MKTLFHDIDIVGVGNQFALNTPMRSCVFSHNNTFYFFDCNLDTLKYIRTVKKKEFERAKRFVIAPSTNAVQSTGGISVLADTLAHTNKDIYIVSPDKEYFTKLLGYEVIHSGKTFVNPTQSSSTLYSIDEWDYDGVKITPLIMNTKKENLPITGYILEDTFSSDKSRVAIGLSGGFHGKIIDLFGKGEIHGMILGYDTEYYSLDFLAGLGGVYGNNIYHRLDVVGFSTLVEYQAMQENIAKFEKSSRV
nr:MAG TPA: hypothetical protein [Caudoviricetes sp.]